MIGERVIVTDKNNEFFNQELTLTGSFATLYRYWVLVDEDETIYLRDDKFELVGNMLNRVVDGITYLVTKQEAATIDSIEARKTKI